MNVCWPSANRRLFKNQMEKCNGCIPARSTYSSRMDMWKRLSNNPIKTNHLKIKQLKQFIMKTIWKATVCIVAVLLSFSIYSCDDDAVGSRDLLLGTWNGVYYLSQEQEDGEKVSDSKEDFVNGTNRYSIEFKEDGTYVEKDVYNSSGSTNYYHGTWSYSGNKLTLIDTEEDNYTEVWTVTTMTENELVYELREKEKEDGTTYEYYEQHAFTRQLKDIIFLFQKDTFLILFLFQKDKNNGVCQNAD